MDAVPELYDALRIKRWVLGVRFCVFWLGWFVFQVDEGVILPGLGCWRLAFGGSLSLSSRWEEGIQNLPFSSLSLPHITITSSNLGLQRSPIIQDSNRVKLLPGQRERDLSLAQGQAKSHF